MEKTDSDAIIDVLKPYVPIKRGIGPYPDKKIPQYMIRLLKDHQSFDAFMIDPKKEFEKEGIDVESVDVEMFKELAVYLNARKSGYHIDFGDIAETVNDKETHTGQEYNFDHSSSWFWGKEGWNVMHERGSKSESERGEMAGQDKDFEKDKGKDGSWIENPYSLLEHDINLIFFPAQPLVTPVLIEKIRDIQNKNL